ncbi:2'-5' RNA ligase [Marinobacter sp. es.048]|uniref:RNA 2',3'-cyclic phosphodiesterase n=1 Tax=Marinobacter sp. es.048 TaxID=1761795 RepID=UPI000B58DA9A|nr:RNA 2',3'-cyclic phosphodiesterase [Marinobacter sp. es.048]SNC75944.1 2'-5' RNA ligase [Marinobacter sp. es.048]
MPRLFFGLELPPEIKDRLLKIRSEVPGAKWQGAEQLHITLLFLGAVSQENLEAVAGSARDIKSEPFLLDVAGVSCFGQPQRPKNLWAGVQPEEPVAALNKTLVARMEKLGFGVERRVFRPHITLARFKRQAGSVEPLLVEYGDFRFGQFQVTEFVLFESKPGRAGSVYSVIERFPLLGAD